VNAVNDYTQRWVRRDAKKNSKKRFKADNRNSVRKLDANWFALLQKTKNKNKGK